MGVFLDHYYNTTYWMPDISEEEHDISHLQHPPQLPPRLQVEFHVAQALTRVLLKDVLQVFLCKS